MLPRADAGIRPYNKQYPQSYFACINSWRFCHR